MSKVHSTITLTRLDRFPVNQRWWCNHFIQIFIYLFFYSYIISLFFVIWIAINRLFCGTLKEEFLLVHVLYIFTDTHTNTSQGTSAYFKLRTALHKQLAIDWSLIELYWLCPSTSTVVLDKFYFSNGIELLLRIFTVNRVNEILKKFF